MELAELGDGVAAEPSKLGKASLLAGAMRSAAEAGTLATVVRLLGGRVLPATDPRVLGVSSAAVRDAVLSATGMEPSAWRAAAIAAGEVGEALAAVHGHFPAASDGARPPLTLGELHDRLTDLAEVTSASGKRERLRRLLLRAAADGPRALAYVGKVLTGDLRIGVAEGLLADAVAEAFGVTPEAVRRGLRSLGDVADVAVLASRGGDAALQSAPFTLFRPVAFMLAATALSAGELAGRVTSPAVLEDKLDGIRVQVHKASDGAAARVELFTRNLERVTGSFPDVVDAVRTVPGEVVLDGELLAVWAGSAGNEGWGAGKQGEAGGSGGGEAGCGWSAAPFAHLQQRLHRRKLSPEVVAAYPVAFVAFDLLYADGELLLDVPLSVRRAKLSAKLAGSRVSVLPCAEVSPGVSAEAIEAAFAASRARRNEGLVLKLLESTYTPGRRGGVWFKLKGHLPTLECVVVRAEVGHGKRRGVLSDYTFAVREGEAPNSPLRVLGKAYSGLTDAEIAELTERFRASATGSDGRRFDVPPDVVLEIAFDAVQRSDRHDSGFALRFPRIVRWRRDRSPGDISTLQDVRQIFLSPDNLNRAEAGDDGGEGTSTGVPRGRRATGAGRRGRAGRGEGRGEGGGDGGGDGGQLSLFGDDGCP